MEPHRLTSNRDIQDIIRTAYDQGWIVEKLQNNHLRWIPPKGRFVHSSCTPNSPNDIKKIKADLKRAGMEFGDPFQRQTKADQVEAIQVEQPKMMHQPIEEPKVEEPQPQKRRVGVKEEVLKVIANNGNARPIGIDTIVERMQPAYPGILPRDIYTSLGAWVTAGKIKRQGQGLYMVAAGVDVIKETAVSEEQKSEMIAEDEQVLNNFFTALAELEQWALRMKRRSEKFEELRKLLSGKDL